MKKWEKLSEEILHKNPWWTYKHDKFKLPNGEEGDYYYMHKRGGVLIIPILDDGRIVMVRQYRYLFGKDSVEFPGGGKKEGQSFEENAQDEIEEETGYRAGKLEFIGAFAPYNGISGETTHVFLATELKKAESHPDETEEMEILYKKQEEIDKMIETGEIWDGQMIAAWVLAKKYLK